jgi:hypothetical protein
MNRGRGAKIRFGLSNRTQRPRFCSSLQLLIVTSGCSFLSAQLKKKEDDDRPVHISCLSFGVPVRLALVFTHASSGHLLRLRCLNRSHCYVSPLIHWASLPYYIKKILPVTAIDKRRNTGECRSLCTHPLAISSSRSIAIQRLERPSISWHCAPVALTMELFSIGILRFVPSNS